MGIKTIERLEDMEGISADEFVEVPMCCQTSQGDVHFANIGVVYNIGGYGRFSLIGPIVSNPLPPVGRINYEWNGRTFIASVNDNQPFEEDSSEYKKYQLLLNEAEKEFLAARR